MQVIHPQTNRVIVENATVEEALKWAQNFYVRANGRNEALEFYRRRATDHSGSTTFDEVVGGNEVYVEYTGRSGKSAIYQVIAAWAADENGDYQMLLLCSPKDDRVCFPIKASSVQFDWNHSDFLTATSANVVH